jgi:hypothetical protein
VALPGAGAARRRFSIGLAFLPPHVAVRAAAYFREAAAAAGRAAAPEHILYRTFAYVAATDGQAQADCAEHGFGALSTPTRSPMSWPASRCAVRHRGHPADPGPVARAARKPVDGCAVPWHSGALWRIPIC